MSETILTLWIIYSTNGKYTEITQVYARDEQHARERARSWLEAHPELPEYHCRPYPDGFQVARARLPGTIKIDTEDEQP